MMLRRFFLLLALLPSMASGGETVLDRARTARNEGLPQVVIHDLRTALAAEENASQRHQLAAELARCLVDAGREQEAITLLDTTDFRDGAGTSETRFWLAQARAQAGFFREALPDYLTLSGDVTFARRNEATLGLGRTLHALNRPSEALDALAHVEATSPVSNLARLESAMILAELERFAEAQSALNSLRNPNRRDDEQRRYLAGCLALAQGDSERALSTFDTLSARNRKLTAGAAIGAAEALVRLNRTDEAEQRVETAIESNPRGPLLAEVMSKLGEVYARQEETSNADLRRWAGDSSAPARAALASYQLARIDEREELMTRAMEGYEAFLSAHPRHPLRAEVTARLVQLRLRAGELEQAVRVLGSAENVAADPLPSGRVRFLRGTANFQAGNYAEASRLFSLAAEASPDLEQNAAFNSALAAILAGTDGGRAEEILRSKHPDLAEEIALARAYRRAAQGAPDGGRELRTLARAGTTPAVRDRARFGLAEWRLVRPDATAEGRNDFRLVADSGVSAEQVGYFEVYAADDGTLATGPRVINAAEAFLAAHPDSPHATRVRLKWGEVLARQGDHRAARVQFETAARSAPDRELAVTALFLAARSAARSMDPALLDQAVLLFDEVAREDGPLAAQARLEQALLKNAAGQTNDALQLLDQLTKETADPRVRLAALLKKGDTLFSLGGRDPERFQEAAAVWERVASDPVVTPPERNEALAKAAAAHAKLGNVDAALSAGTRVLDAPRDTLPEFFWYYRAGFDAGQLLESRGQLKEAIAIYEKMAATEGPRSAEFAQRVKRLRLENFIWEN